MMLALVFVALAVVLLRPFCEIEYAGEGNSAVAGFVTAAGHDIASHPGRGDTPSATCCSNVKDGTPVKSAEVLTSWTRGDLPGALLFASAGLLLFARPRNPAGRRLAVPPGSSFYTRSARILR
jgi:hypothetical protein